MPLNVNLTEPLEEMVRRKVSSGLYASASEVVREALRLMEQQDRAEAIKLEQLRAEVRRGLASGPGVSWDAAELKRQARQRRAARPSKA